AQYRRPFQIVPFEKLGQVVDKVSQPEAAPQGKAIVLSAQLIADNAKVAGKNTSEWAEEFETAGQPGYQDQRRSLAPLAVLCGVVGQMGTSRSTGTGTELRAGSSQPIPWRLLSASPFQGPS